MKKDIERQVKFACGECRRKGELTNIETVRRILTRKKITIAQGELLTLLHIEWRNELREPVVREVKTKLRKLSRRQTAFVLRGAMKGKRSTVAA